MRFILSLLLIFFFFLSKSMAVSVYEQAAIEEAGLGRPASSVCMVSSSEVPGEGFFGSGVLVELEGMRVVLTAKHVLNPRYVHFQTEGKHIGGITERGYFTIKVAESYQLEPDIPYHVGNDACVLFLSAERIIWPEIKALKLRNRETDVSRDLIGYGYGYILEKGVMPWSYHYVGSAQLKKLRFQASLGRDFTFQERLMYRRISSIPIGPTQPLLRLESEFNPSKLRHPFTQGFSGGPLLDENEEVVGLFHSTSVCPILTKWYSVATLSYFLADAALYHFCPNLSPCRLISKLFGKIHPTVGTAAQVVYSLFGLYFLGSAAEVLIRKHPFWYVPKNSFELAVFLPPLLPQLQSIVRDNIAGFQQRQKQSGVAPYVLEK